VTTIKVSIEKRGIKWRKKPFRKVARTLNHRGKGDKARLHVHRRGEKGRVQLKSNARGRG